jgi:hypothetical protein
VGGGKAKWLGEYQRARVENRKEKNKCRENEREGKYKREIDVETERN